MSIVGPELPGARVLDLFAGTGALGLEALSRGAAFCLFVDHAADARAAIRGNVESLGLGGVTRLLRRDATRLGAAASPPCTLAFLDPPYARGLAERALAGAAAGGWLAPGALAVVEEATAAAFAVPHGFALEERRAAGDSQLLFLRHAGAAAEPPPPPRIGTGREEGTAMPDEPKNDPSEKSPAEGDRETVERELERQRKKRDDGPPGRRPDPDAEPKK